MRRAWLGMLFLLLVPIPVACGGTEEHAIYFDLDQASPCWDPSLRIRALQVRVTDAAQFPTVLPTISGFDECLPVDLHLTRIELGKPFATRGYLVSGLPAGKPLAAHVMAYAMPTCPKPEQRAFAICLSSEKFVAELATRVQMHSTCGPLSLCGAIR